MIKVTDINRAGQQNNSGENSEVKSPKSRRKFFGLLLVLALAAIYFFFVRGNANFPTIDSSKWQAVVLLNGQSYFGHLESVNNGYIKLNSAYYLQENQSTDPKQPKVNLLKVGTEVYSPENTIFIPKDKIVYWQNLREDSNMKQALDQLEKK